MRVVLAVLFLTACGAATRVTVAPSQVPGVTAPAVQSQNSEDIDPCEERGRYGDGVCDETCPEVDPDCDPRVCLLSPESL